MFNSWPGAGEPICGICQLTWFQFSHHGWFQAIHVHISHLTEFMKIEVLPEPVGAGSGATSSCSVWGPGPPPQLCLQKPVSSGRSLHRKWEAVVWVRGLRNLQCQPPGRGLLGWAGSPPIAEAPAALNALRGVCRRVHSPGLWETPDRPALCLTLRPLCMRMGLWQVAGGGMNSCNCPCVKRRRQKTGMGRGKGGPVWCSPQRIRPFL